MKIAILGGGHGCYAAAADLSEADHEVLSLAARRGCAGATLRAGASCSRTLTACATCRSPAPPSDIAAAVRGAELIVIPTPAIAQDDIALCAGAAPRRWPGRVPAARHLRQLRDGAHRAPKPATGRVAWAETGTLPYLARKHGEREVNVTIRAIRLPTGVYPARKSQEAIEVIRKRLPERARVRRRAFRRADERRSRHPPAADGDERRAAAALRSLGHPQRRHAARRARRDRPLDQERMAVREAFG